MNTTPSASNLDKEGLQAAIDLTKYTLTVAGAAIAFLLSSETLKNVTRVDRKLLVTVALLGFGCSAIGGVMVLMESASNLANKQYELNQPFLRIPGIINIIGLGAGLLFATLFVLEYVWMSHST
jgi:hypothetical protein